MGLFTSSSQVLVGKLASAHRTVLNMRSHKVINLLHVYNQVSRASINTDIDTFSVLVNRVDTVSVAILAHTMYPVSVVG